MWALKFGFFLAIFSAVCFHVDGSETPLWMPPATTPVPNYPPYSSPPVTNWVKGQNEYPTAENLGSRIDAALSSSPLFSGWKQQKILVRPSPSLQTLRDLILTKEETVADFLVLVLKLEGQGGQPPFTHVPHANVSQIGVCDLPRAPGPCRADMPSWHFDPSSQICFPFSYGGCQGNGNRFTSEALCLAMCGGQGQGQSPNDDDHKKTNYRNESPDGAITQSPPQAQIPQAVPTPSERPNCVKERRECETLCPFGVIETMVPAASFTMVTMTTTFVCPPCQCAGNPCLHHWCSEGWKCHLVQKNIGSSPRGPSGKGKNFLPECLPVATATLYSKPNFQGSRENYNYPVVESPGCKNLVELGDRVQSIRTFGSCVTLYQGRGCVGVSKKMFSPNLSISHYRRIDPQKFGVFSIGPCASK